jgi:hypothetical protein
LRTPHRAKGSLVYLREAVDLAVTRRLRRQVDRSLGKRKGLSRYHAMLVLAGLLMHQLRLLDCRQKVSLIKRELCRSQAVALIGVRVKRKGVVLLVGLHLRLLLKDDVIHL